MTRILIAIDGSEPSEKALDFALDRHADADLVAVAVLDPTAYVQGSADLILPDTESWREDAEEGVKAVLESAADRAGTHGIDLETEMVYGAPARSIVEYADDHDVDQIIVGSHGRDGVSRVLLGSVAETVVRRSSVPVTVVR
ncbi:universal stress protein UspA [Salinigranum rubrum]|uniref:Universal stress protein UspA n=1 Tax=Salinigranum rubrum TaxID=755307 RepID=A0A2I8VNF5_9EURY|nr:universal stress protein [Salinigranum rubrum]AUV83470.1 universal stress protein UspA [Salinigranum rubrum]